MEYEAVYIFFFFFFFDVRRLGLFIFMRCKCCIAVDCFANDEATDDLTSVSCIELDDGSLVEVLGKRESSSYNHITTIETKCPVTPVAVSE